MRVIIGILLILAALMTVVHFNNVKPMRTRDGPVDVRAEPLVLDSSDPERTQLGDLHFLGAWQLTSSNEGFGGLSSMLLRPDGNLWALNDSGVLFSFPQPGAKGPARATRLRPLPFGGPGTAGPTDSESMVVDDRSGQLWVGYELAQRICRFALDLHTVGACRSWKEFAKWPVTESLETMVRLPDGRFLLISEGEASGKGGREAMLFNGDPVGDSSQTPVTMTYMPPPGYNPTDAIWIGGTRLLVLNRRATIYDGFTAIITLVDIGHMGPDAVLTSRIVARLVPPVLADNFEGMAMEKQDGQRILWIVSDDNHMFFQRTLLLKFAVPESF